ncbi:MAG: hypothetical protein PVH68_02015 [Armatimonadota bacterium]|jgi:hypothetical protein
MIVGTRAEQLARLGRSMDDILIAPCAGPDDGERAEPGGRLIQFGRVAVDNALALHLYVVSGHRRFSFMWSVLGRDMMGCLVLAEPANEEAMANARDVLDAVRACGLQSVVVGAGGDAELLEQMVQSLRLTAGVPVIPCDAGDRVSVRQALCAVLREMRGDRAPTPAVAGQDAVSAAAGVA